MNLRYPCERLRSLPVLVTAGSGASSVNLAKLASPLTKKPLRKTKAGRILRPHTLPCVPAPRFMGIVPCRKTPRQPEDLSNPGAHMGTVLS